MTRRGFTMIEMALALALSSVVMLSVYGLFTFIDRADRDLSRRFHDITELERCHAALRRAMQTLVAAAPVDDDQPAAAANARGLARTTRDRDNASRAASAATSNAPPRFYLGPVVRDDASKRDRDRKRNRTRRNNSAGDSENDTVNTEPPAHATSRLEVVLTGAPFAYAGGGATNVRGAFDKIRDGRNWKLQWTPINPPGEPVVLIDDLAEIFWAVLLREGWVDQHTAVSRGEYPRAVRVAIFTRGGSTADWMFEPGVTIGDEP